MSVLVVKKEGSEACSCLLLFAFQTRSRLKNTRKESHYFLHWIKVLFFASFIEFYQCFDCQSKILHRARGFCFFRGVRDIPVKSTNFFQTCWISMTKVEKKKQQQTNKQKQKNIKNAWKRYFFLIACNLRLFAHSSSSPKRKY